MDSVTRILILAQPGHFRSSLVALLKTLPRVDLFLVDDLASLDHGFPPQAAPHLVLADRERLGYSAQEAMDALRRHWPSVHCLVLVDNVFPDSAPWRVSVDCVMAKSAPAGEFLRAVQQLSAARESVATPTWSNIAWIAG